MRVTENSLRWKRWSERRSRPIASFTFGTGITSRFELFALNVRQQVAVPVSDEDVDKLYRKHLLEVELVPACAPQSGP
jgi:hypothetical protein